jgi:type IV pilus biogenesis protein PilP
MKPIFIRWLWAVAITAALVVLLAPKSAITTRASAIADSGWSVPRLNTQDMQPFAATLSRSTLWGATAEQPGAGTDDRAKQWRLAAVAGVGRDRNAIIEFGDGRIASLKVGEKFPDGTPIVDIKNNGVCVRLSNGVRLLPLASQTVPIVW